MGGSSEFDFLRQIPATLILAPVFFGALYIGAMVIVFRRAAKRRRIARGEIAPDTPRRGGFTPTAASTRNAGVSPIPAAPAPKTPSASALPEPDLDLLLTPTAPSVPATPPAALEAPAPEEMGFSIDDLMPPDVVQSALNVAPAPKEPTPPKGSPMGSGMAAAAERRQTGPLEASNAESGDAIELLRVWRDLSDGRLLIQMGNQRYRSLGEIRNPDLMRRFNAVVAELFSMSADTPQPASAPPASITPGDRIPTPPGGTFFARPPEPEKGRRGRRTQEVQEPGAGIANAVEAYLQTRLMQNPALSLRSIHIRPSHDTGLSIEVDGHFYDSIQDVVDPNVREFLLGVMREWEARH